MRPYLKILFSAWALCGACLAWADSEVVGYVSSITTDFVEIRGKSYPLFNGDSNDMRARYPAATECWAKERTTCGTLAGVGYIDKARVTLRNGVAIRIQVLEMRQ